MNKKLIGAVLGTLAFGSMTVTARAEEAPAKQGDAAKDKKADPAKKDAHKGKKGDKSCGGAKGCGGEKK